MENRINISFIGGRFRYWRGTHNLQPKTIFAIAAILLGIDALLLFGASRNWSNESRLQAELSELKVRQKGIERAMASSHIDLEAGKAVLVNRYIAQLNLPWARIFRVIEQHTGATVALLSLEPSSERRVLRITGEASSAENMLAYVTRLKSSEELTNVRLIRHEINKDDPYSPYRFQVEASWERTQP